MPPSAASPNKYHSIFHAGHRAALVQALVQSRLDYANIFLLGLLVKWLKKVQMVQNMAARLVTGLNLRAHITPTLYFEGTSLVTLCAQGALQGVIVMPCVSSLQLQRPRLSE